jgi:hypothetical protein
MFTKRSTGSRQPKNAEDLYSRHKSYLPYLTIGQMMGLCLSPTMRKPIVLRYVGLKGTLPLPMLLHQELGMWLTNNWRPYVTVKASKSGRRYTKIDAVWGTEKEAVEMELKTILGVDQLDPSSQEYFQQRTAAAKNVYDRMDEHGKQKIDNEVERGKTEANKPEVQQK